MNRSIVILLTLLVFGCTSDPYTREQKVSETAKQGGVAAAQCGGLTLVANLLAGQSGGDSLAEAGKAAVVCGVVGAVGGAQLDAYEHQLLNEFQLAGVKMAVRNDARVLEVEEPIMFSRNGAKLTPSNVSKVAAIGKILQKYNERRVDVIGHAASDEAAGLGLARAKSVTGQLHQMTGGQVPLQTLGKGAGEPVGDNKTETGRQRNRRVVIFVALHAGT